MLMSAATHRLPSLAPCAIRALKCGNSTSLRAQDRQPDYELHRQSARMAAGPVGGGVGRGFKKNGHGLGQTSSPAWGGGKFLAAWAPPAAFRADRRFGENPPARSRSTKGLRQLTPAAPLADRMGRLIRIKATPICDYKNRCDYAALTRITRPKAFYHRCGGEDCGRKQIAETPDSLDQLFVLRMALK